MSSHQDQFVQSPNAPRWLRCLPAFCAFVGMLIEQCPISDDIFDRIVALICLARGQDDEDIVFGSALEDVHEVVEDMLGSKSGRKGELAIRNILEGKVATISNNRSLKVAEEDRKIVRGAVL
jgi:hypothetical protein